MIADTLLFDGNCRICTKAAHGLKARAGGALVLENFRDPDVLLRFPTIRLADCEQAVRLVRGDGPVEYGVGALIWALKSRWYGAALRVFLLPGLRSLADLAYSVFARFRFRLSGSECSDGCALYR